MTAWIDDDPPPFTGELVGPEPANSAVTVCFEAWRDAVSSTFVPLEASTAREQGFSGAISAHSLGEVALAAVGGSAVTVTRNRRMIKREDRGLLKLGLQLRGYCLVTQDDREAALTPGDFALYDTSRAYELEFERDFQMLVIMFPRELLSLRSAELAALTARRISGRRGMGAVMSPFVTTLAARAATGDLGASVHLSDAVLDLITATCVENLPVDGRTARPNDQTLLLRIQGFIDERLGDPDLCSSQVALAHHISLRYLQKLFEARGTTVTDWIRQRRVERCRRDLLDPRLRHLPVSSIGGRWGFIEPAHFSRVFKQLTGLTPTAARETFSS